MGHNKENHYWVKDGAQELRPEHAHLLRYRGTYCFEHNPKGHGMKATLVFPAGTEGIWVIAKFDEQMNYPEDEYPTPAGVWITFSRESFQIDEEPANSLQGVDGCRGIKGLDHRWVPGIITGALYCSKCGQPKDLEDVKARFMDRMGLAEAQTEQQPVEMGELRVRLENGHKQFEFEEYSAAYALPDGTHYLYTAPIAQTEQHDRGEFAEALRLLELSHTVQGVDTETVHAFLDRHSAALSQQAESVSRDWVEDFEHENGNYSCRCCQCGEQFAGHKRRVVCKVCDSKAEPAPAQGEREAFELHAALKKMDIGMFTPPSDGKYRDPRTQAAWEGWESRAEQTEQQPVGEVRCDGDMIWQIDGDPAVWRGLGEGTKLYTAPIAQTEQPVAWRDEAGGTLYPSRESVAKYLPEGRIATPLYAAPIKQAEQQPVRVVVDISGGAIHGVYADRPVTIYFKSDDKDDVAHILCDLDESEMDKDMKGEPIASWVHDAGMDHHIVDHYHNQTIKPEEPAPIVQTEQQQQQQHFTAFCQQADGKGTIWIGKVWADGCRDAALEARTLCAQDWGYDVLDVHCLGLATGDVEIVYWKDLSDE